MAVKRLKDTWKIFRQFNKEDRWVEVNDRREICVSLCSGDREDWLYLLREYGGFTKVISIEIETYKSKHSTTILKIVIDKPDLVFIGRRKELRGKKAKEKYWINNINAF